MSTRKIGNNWWIDFRHEHVRYRRRSPDNSRAGAAAYEATVRSRLARGGTADECVPPPVLHEFAPKWLTTWSRPNDKPSEYERKVLALKNHLLPAFGTRALSAITARDLEQYKCRKLSEGYANQTVNNQLNVLTKCLRTAMEWDIIATVPRVRRLRANSERLDFLTDAESSQLLSGFRDPVWRAMAVVALRTGMRLGELLALQWQDVDLDRGQLEVRRSLSFGEVVLPKSNKSRRIPLVADTVQALGELAHGGACEPVFAQPTGGMRTHTAARSAMMRALRRTGIRHIGWHTLRHTFASQLAIRGASMRVIQVLLGHASVKTTEQYAHLSSDALDAAVRTLAKLDNGFGQPVGKSLAAAPGNTPGVPVMLELRPTHDNRENAWK